MSLYSPDPLESLEFYKEQNEQKKRHNAGKSTIVHNLLRREIHATQLHHSNPFGEMYPDRFRMPIEQIIPRYALEAGNIFMGFTDCGRYLMSYTARPSDNFGVSWGELTFMYKLHFWLFVPYKPTRKVSSVVLFDNNGVSDNNLLIEISGWKNDDKRILITGQSSNPDGDMGDPHHTQFFATVTTIPPNQNCIECQYVPDEEMEEEFGESRILQPCLRHGLTIHLTFDHVSPFPKFDSDIQLRFKDSVAFNTGNVLHVFSFKLLEPEPVKPAAAVIATTTPPFLSPGRNDIAPLLQPHHNHNNNNFPFLRCDLWFKSNYSLTTILNKGPIRDDTKFHDTTNRRSSYILDSSQEESNILSINAQECFLAILPYMNTANQKIIKETLPNVVDNYRLVRRLSQSSLDSLDYYSENSPNPQKSPSPCHVFHVVSSNSNNSNQNKNDKNSALKTTNVKPSSNNHTSNSNNNNTSGTSSHKSDNSNSPNSKQQKLMLPPQERKFFKRRTSSSSSANSTPVKQEQPILRKPTNKSASSSTPSNATCSSPKDSPCVSNDALKSSGSAYDVFEISVFPDLTEVLQERSFSSFRKRRLADKKYEFSEADFDSSTENIIPLKLCRSSRKSGGLNRAGSNSYNALSNNNSNSSSNNNSSTFMAVVGGLGYDLSGGTGGGDSPRSPRHHPLYGDANLNYPRSPRDLGRGSGYVLSPAMSPNSELDVLRPLNNNLSVVTVKCPAPGSPISKSDEVSSCDDMGKVITRDESRSRGNTPKRTFGGTSCQQQQQQQQDDIIKSDHHNYYHYSHRRDVMHNSYNKRSLNPNAKPTMGVSINCVAKVLRSYIQKEDDNVSVITDIEDDNCGQPFPVATPLEVHGTAYQQLNMISNSKAEKCQVPVVQVLQRTLDIELLCNEIAGIICHSADKYYCSCCDYDAAIVDVCPNLGTITAIVFVLVQAATLKIEKGRNYDRNVHPGLGYQDPRKKYEAVFSFAWEPSTEYCRILYLGNLLELPTVTDHWHPTKHILSLVKICSKGNCYSDTNVLNNHLAVHDFLSVEELTDKKGMFTLYKDESSQKTDRRYAFTGSVGRFHSTANSSSSGSVTTTSDSSDDEED